MDDYRKAVSKACIKRNGHPVIENRSTAHAAVIFEYLFKAANSSVKILTHNLDRSVYGDPAVISAARNYLLRSDGKIEILTEENIPTDHPFIASLKHPAGQVVVTTVPSILQQRYTFNFCVVDEDCYRFEPDRKACDATIQFGNSSMGAKIKVIFEALLQLSQFPEELLKENQAPQVA